MATQSIEVKDFTGGRNFVTSPFNIYPTEAQVFKNISLDSTNMVTRNFLPYQQLLQPRPTQGDPIQVAPKLGEEYDLTTASESYWEKVRFFQGERYIISGGIPYQLGNNNAKYSTVIANILDATAPQTVYAPMGDVDVNFKVPNYTYFISYRSPAGYESPLEEIGSVNGLLQWDTEFTTLTPSEQTIIVTTAPAAGYYGRVYRMGDNISFPSLVFQFDDAWTVSLNRGPVIAAAGTFKFSLLDDQLGNYATTWGAVYPTNLRYLTATKYGLAATDGSQLYLSLGKADGWSALASLNFGATISGVASIYKGILVFTENAYSYLVTGSSPANLQVNIISSEVGCSANASITDVGQNALIWIYNRRFYSFNGSVIQELEANTYDFDYFATHGMLKEVTAVSLFNKYLVGDKDGIVMIDLNHRYKPFSNYDIAEAFRPDNTPVYLRELVVGGIKSVGAYQGNGSFYSFQEVTYGEVSYIDPIPPTEGWAMGCYGGLTDCATDDTTCIGIGCYGVYPVGVPQCTGLDPTCLDGAAIGGYPDYVTESYPILHRSVYTSPLFTFGNMNAQCTFSSVEVLYEGSLTIIFGIDSKATFFIGNYRSNIPRTARLILSNSRARGNFGQVKLVFNGIVYGYRVNGEPLQQLSV